MLEEFFDWSHAKLGVDSMILLSYYKAAKAELSIPGSSYHDVAKTVVEWGAAETHECGQETYPTVLEIRARMCDGV